MKKLFLTSGVILGMLGQASASTDIGYSGNTYGASGCTYPYLDTYDVSSSLEAKWDANISGAITLDSNRYSSATATQAASTASTAAAAAMVYSKYGIGIYPSSADATAETNAIAALTTSPEMTGYVFKGFYTGKAGSGTQVINASGSYLSAANTQITTLNATATWYAHWTPDVYTISLKSYDGADTHSTVYEKYDNGWFSNAEATTAVANNKVSVPSREGYTFRGFYTEQQADVTANNSSGTQRVTKDGTLPANNTFTADTSLFAAWAQNCSAGTGCECELSVSDTGAVTYTTSAETGYTLTSGSGTNAPVCTPVSKTITYSCGTKPGSETQSGTVPTAGTATYDATYNIAENTCVYKGWTFDGWSCDYNLATGEHTTTDYAADAAGTSKLQNDVTCTAKWKANTISLTWSANGGTAQDGTTYQPGAGTGSCVYDSSITLPAVPKRDGYTFTGWTVSSTSN